MWYRAFNAHALAALAEVAGSGLNTHLSTVLPPLISTMDDHEVFDELLALSVDYMFVLKFLLKFETGIRSLRRGYVLIFVCL